jgi:protein-S-isoprenylcysteine O-methyltransferase Ste14
VSRADLQDRAATPTEEEAEPQEPLIAVRRADGGLADFSEIVTPHPVIGFLFRRRTLIVLLAILALAWFSKPQPAMIVAALAVAFLAEVWRVWAAGTIHKTEELTTAGPYAYVRHPLYVGSFLHAIAYCLFSGRWESFLIVPPLFFLLYGAAVSTEEAMLRKIFGRRYDEYSERVPRFVPRLGSRPRGEGAFSWAQVAANKEYVNVIWVVILSSLFVLKLILSGHS